MLSTNGVYVIWTGAKYKISKTLDPFIELVLMY